MIAAALFLAAQAAAPALAEPEPIVVIGRRLQAIAVTVGQGPDGAWHCGMDGTTGRTSLDQKLCKAVTNCVRKGATKDEEVAGCVASTKRSLLRALERERARR